MTSVTSTASYSPSEDIDCDWTQAGYVVSKDPSMLTITADHLNTAKPVATMREVDIVAYPVNSQSPRVIQIPINHLQVM